MWESLAEYLNYASRHLSQRFKKLLQTFENSKKITRKSTTTLFLDWF